MIDIEESIMRALGADTIKNSESVQALWSGYGEIRRYFLRYTSGSAGDSSSPESVIAKTVELDHANDHPRGWSTDVGHQRKLRSYQVESEWYKRFAQQCNDTCRVAKAYASLADDDGFLIVLEDLDAAGFSDRKSQASLHDIHLCLSWLANFHATFLETEPNGLWPVGTYWHLETRPDELDALDDQDLKESATEIDQKLSECKHQTIVHGDAKLANFCFTTMEDSVAAVDFQYVGGGCGMKDVAYFIGSCFNEEDSEALEAELLHIYFTALGDALDARNSSVNKKELEAEWRALFKYAWADFHRFLKGWSPGHWKLNAYSERVTREVLDELKRT